MPLDLSKLSGAPLLDTETHPREIFNLLPSKHKRYEYLRDVQGEVLARWFDRRADSSIVIKMNTGGGKTVVGLLALKSCLNEGCGPAYYVAPDIYLSKQVMREAHDLGLSVVESPDAPAVLQGRAIGVINIRTLINGKSRFGVGAEGQKIKIGSVLIDDAHACLATTESQFTIEVPAHHAVYSELLTIFRDDLAAQSETTLSELDVSTPDAYMLVPFWAWDRDLGAVAKVLAAHADDPAFMFPWRLTKDYLKLCRCVIGSKAIEIAPRCLPIEAIPSFAEAKRKIFMTATLADDSILVTDFNANADLIKKHITPSSGNDIGDRMILVPQEIDPEITDEALRDFLSVKSAQYNVVVIVPSAYRAEFWRDKAAQIVTAENIDSAVSVLKVKHVGLVVLVNKYDGVDLPDEACRILVLDGLPRAHRLVERVETQMLRGSPHILGRQIQRIEQGMGRGIRSNDDYCAVLLMGASLIRDLFVADAQTLFSRATLAQLKLSHNVAAQIGPGIEELNDAIDFCLKQSPDWRKLAREALANITYPPEGSVRPVALAQRQAFDHAIIQDIKGSTGVLEKILNDDGSDKIVDDTVRGWLMWQLAEYKHLQDPVEAQKILKSALGRNRAITKPIGGIDYEKLDAKKLEQAKNVVWALKPYIGAKNKLLLAVNAILADMRFLPETSKRFEQAVKDIALFLGFRGQRPEAEFGKGPDDLWAVGNLKYFVIECKNGATTGKVSKHDCNQLSGSVNWFKERYDGSCSCTPILIHPSRVFEHAATPHEGARIVTVEGLAAMKEAIARFITAASADLDTLNSERASGLLSEYRLFPDAFVESFTVTPMTSS
ncbi:MAG: helicase C-terminal domain-containing protein [Rhodospirillaceae bacterium]